MQLSKEWRGISDAELCLPLVRDVQMVISQGSDAPSPGGPGQETQLHQVRLVHIFRQTLWLEVQYEERGRKEAHSLGNCGPETAGGAVRTF